MRGDGRWWTSSRWQLGGRTRGCVRDLMQMSPTTAVAVKIMKIHLLSLNCCLQDYLRDTHHPNDWFLNNVLNIYLNLFHDHHDAATRQQASA